MWMNSQFANQVVRGEIRVLHLGIICQEANSMSPQRVDELIPIHLTYFGSVVGVKVKIMNAPSPISTNHPSHNPIFKNARHPGEWK